MHWISNYEAHIENAYMPSFLYWLFKSPTAGKEK